MGNELPSNKDNRLSKSQVLRLLKAKQKLLQELEARKSLQQKKSSPDILNKENPLK
jgi:hypothetical protein